MDLTEELVSGLVREIKGSYKVLFPSPSNENQGSGHHKIGHSCKVLITVHVPWCQGY